MQQGNNRHPIDDCSHSHSYFTCSLVQCLSSESPSTSRGRKCRNQINNYESNQCKKLHELHTSQLRLQSAMYLSLNQPPPEMHSGLAIIATCSAQSTLITSSMLRQHKTCCAVLFVSVFDCSLFQHNISFLFMNCTCSGFTNDTVMIDWQPATVVKILLLLN